MEMLTPATVRALLTEHGIRPKKSLGQHFLADPNTRASGRRRSPSVQPGDAVLEIGPGLGSLTLALLERGARVLARRARRHARPRARVGARRPRSDRDDRSRCASADALLGRRGRRCSSRAPSGRACRTCPTTSPCPWWCGCSRRRRRQSHRGDGAARGGGAPCRRAGRHGVRRGVGEGRVLRRGRVLGPVSRRRCSFPGRRSSRRSCGCTAAPTPPVSVPSEAELFALVRGGFAQRRKMLRRSLRAGARRPRAPEVLERGRRRAHGAGRGARPRGVGRARPVRGGGRMRLARVRATAYPKLTLSLRVLGRRADGFHDLDALVVSLGQPHDVLEAYAVPAPGGVQVEVVGDDAARRRARATTATSRSSPPRSCWCAPGARATVCASCCASRSPRVRGLGGGSADAAAALLAVRRLLDVDIDDAGVARARGRDRVRRARSACAAARRGCAGAARSSKTVSLPTGLGVRRRDPAVPAVDARRVPRVGRARRPARATRTVPAPRRVGADPARARQRPRAGGRERSSRASWSSAPRSRRPPDAPRCSRGAGRPTWCRCPTRGTLPAPRRRRCSRRLRVPVVGTTSVSRGVRLARRCPRRTGVSRPRRRGLLTPVRSEVPSGPAGGAASACASEASCASSSACACGAS